MPVERSRGHAGRALTVSVVAIGLIVAALYGVSVLSSRQDGIDVRLGDQTFQGGDVERLAAEIEERGPIFYGDVSDSGSGDARDIILQHIGDDPEEGWFAFAAQPADKPRDCTWQWQPDEELFRAACDDDLTAPADGEGLRQYPIEIVDGDLDIDLNFERRVTESTTTTVIESGEVPPTTDG